MFWHTIWLTLYLRHILTVYLTNIQTFYLTSFLTHIYSDLSLGSLSGILSGILSDILSCILSDILSDISGILSDILSETIWHPDTLLWDMLIIWHSFRHLSWHSTWFFDLTFYVAFYLVFYFPSISHFLTHFSNISSGILMHILPTQGGGGPSPANLLGGWATPQKKGIGDDAPILRRHIWKKISDQTGDVRNDQGFHPGGTRPRMADKEFHTVHLWQRLVGWVYLVLAATVGLHAALRWQEVEIWGIQPSAESPIIIRDC